MTSDFEVSPLVGIVVDALIAREYDFLGEAERGGFDLAEDVARTVLIALADSAEAVAERFHEHYEVLAPAYAYETRVESSVPWRDVPERNRKLMIATVGTVFSV